jgi:hypothetical protein
LLGSGSELDVDAVQKLCDKIMVAARKGLRGD